MPTIPPEVYGPAGLLVFLIIVVWRLWRLHEASDLRRETLIDTLAAQVPELISSNKTMAEVIKTRLSVADKTDPEDDDGDATYPAVNRRKRGSGT